jgi:hypothetical protein
MKKDEAYWISLIKQDILCIRECGVKVGFESKPIIKVRFENYEQPLPNLECLYWFLTAYHSALLSLRQIAPAKEFQDKLDSLVRVMDEYGSTSSSYPPTYNAVIRAYRKALLGAQK